MSTHVRIVVESPDRGLSKTVTLVVESQGEPRQKLLAIRLNREQLSSAIGNGSGGDAAFNQRCAIDGELVQAS